MGNEEKIAASESFVMKGGDGPSSYTRNSFYQKNGVERVSTTISKGITDNLDINQLFSPSSTNFTIVDLGCSVGPNTFIAVENIIESVKLKCRSNGFDPSIIEFQAYFNDHIFNDFNLLFKSLPLNKQYYAAGVPGSFHGRLFPKTSIHFVHSSYSLQWLSKVPQEITDKDSLAWNKGRIYYRVDSPNSVLDAYISQFSKDMEVFLNARATELVPGGLMAILLPGSSTSSRKASIAILFEFLGSALMDIANLGLISEEKVDSFNLPVHHPTKEELEGLIERNTHFSIERMEAIEIPRTLAPTAEALSMHLKAGYHGLIGKHFGYEIIDEVFDRFRQKIAESSFLSNLSSGKIPAEELFVLLRRI